jgi:hypothetical protein
MFVESGDDEGATPQRVHWLQEKMARVARVQDQGAPGLSSAATV